MFDDSVKLDGTNDVGGDGSSLSKVDRPNYREYVVLTIVVLHEEIDYARQLVTLE